MRNVKIITDSCSDLSGEQLAAYGIDYAKMNTVYHGKEIPATLTWDSYSPKEMYDTIRGGERVTTTQVPVEEFDRIFRKYLDMGMDIVYIGCSIKQSGSVNTGTIVANKLKEEYPEASIFCINSLNASLGEGMLAIRASEMAANGMTAQEINDAILPLRNRVNQYVTVHTLEHLKKAGRVKAASAFFGNLMGIKPILISDKNGEQTPIKKVKGRANSLNEMVRMLKESTENPENQTIYLAHADCTKEEIDAIVGMIREQIPCKDVAVGYIGPIIGASIGPDAIGIWSFGKEITYAFKEN